MNMARPSISWRWLRSRLDRRRFATLWETELYNVAGHRVRFDCELAVMGFGQDLGDFDANAAGLLVSRKRRRGFGLAVDLAQEVLWMGRTAVADSDDQSVAGIQLSENVDVRTVIRHPDGVFDNAPDSLIKKSPVSINLRISADSKLGVHPYVAALGERVHVADGIANGVKHGNCLALDFEILSEGSSEIQNFQQRRVETIGRFRNIRHHILVLSRRYRAIDFFLHQFRKTKNSFYRRLELVRNCLHDLAFEVAQECGSGARLPQFFFSLAGSEDELDVGRKQNPIQWLCQERRGTG